MSTREAALLVADSFRVRLNPTTGEAEVRGWRDHLARFRHSIEQVCSEVPGDLSSDVSEFLAQASVEIQEFGEGFPRLELWGHANQRLELAVRLRALPQLGGSVVMRSAPAGARPNPHRKGPNIAHYAKLNQRLGAEALLTDTAGLVLEGSTTSLIWWNAAVSNGYVVSDRAHRVPSVTEQLLISSTELTPAQVTPLELSGHEVWAVNALHGIRLVTSIDEIPTQTVNTDRLSGFLKILETKWEPVFVTGSK